MAAFEILERIENDRSFSSALLPIYEERLGDSDRGLCHELVLGVLRRQLYLDKIIEHFAGSKKLDSSVRLSLRLGIYQLLFLDKVPAYSAINESVNLVQKARKTSAKGFVNAILRRVSEKVPHLEFTGGVERISIETSHPVWLIEKWISDFGLVDAEQIAASNNRLPRIAFRFTNKSDAHSASADFEQSAFVEGCYFARSISQEMLELASNGEIYFQDEASQLVGRIAAAAKAGDRFLDVCASPGGKTTLAASARKDGEFVVAGDYQPSRVRLLRETCTRQGMDFVNIVQYDAEFVLPFANGSFDTVLVDAPCSGTGTIRHNPEIRYYLEPGDFQALARKQRQILSNASKVVRPGGRLIYSTCSLQVEENEIVCERFLAGNEQFVQVRPHADPRFVTATGSARTFPHRDDMDGFFIAEFQRLQTG